MSWLRALWAWLIALFKTTPAGSWGIHGNTVTGTITGATINTSHPIIDGNTTPRAWAVSPDKKSFSTTL